MPRIAARRLFPAVALVLLFGCAALSFAAGAPRALPAGQQQQPHDSRLGKLRTLDDYFPFTPVESLAAWKDRAAKVPRRAERDTSSLRSRS